MYFRALGRSIIVLNDKRTTIDLLEKRSAIYSSRVHSPVIPMCVFSILRDCSVESRLKHLQDRAGLELWGYALQ